MWSEKLANGKTRYKERFTNPLTGKYETVSITVAKDSKSARKAAYNQLQERIKEKLNNLSYQTKKANLTLLELSRLYLEYQSVSVKQSTLKRNTTAVNSMNKILGADTLVDRLTAGFVRKALADLNEAPGTTNERLTRFKAMIRWGYANDLIADIRWIDKLTPLKNEESKRKLEDKFLEAKELKKLLNGLAVEKWRFLAELMALSGLRCGEAIVLTQEDVDFDERTIHVTKTFDIRNKITTSPKTSDSIREVYMQDELFDLCKRINLHMLKERFATGVSSNLFMHDVTGDVLDYDAFNKYLRENAERILGKRITTHFLRHTHVALLAEKKIPLDAISRRLGHSDSMITKNIYFHVTDTLKEKENRQIRKVKLL